MKVLITADIHINDYSNYNYEYRSRFNQYLLLANRLVEIGQQENCQELWILGDLIDIPVSKGYILHRANDFIKIVCNGFKNVRYILGNHDVSSKSQSLEAEDAQITIFDQSNLFYMDREVISAEHTFAFMNWRPEQDLDWLPIPKVDVLLGHYTKMDNYGQDIDESRFDLMIHGDIHNSQVIGKFVSVCNPIQKDMNSEQEGKVIILDTVTLDWKRVLTDPDHTRFLQIAYTEDQAQEGFHGPLQYYIYKPKIVVQAETGESTTLDWNSVDELINSTCKNEGLEEIHSEITAKCQSLQEIDFNFQLVGIHIHGYRSITDLDLNFNLGDRIALLGPNGSGKSSIIGAFRDVFGKNSEIKYRQSDFTEDGDLYVTIRLTYQNKLYEITKGCSWGLVIDGQEQPYQGVRAFEEDLHNKLPFIDYLDLMFLDSNISSLSDKFSQNKRIDLIAKFYRLDRINSYYQTALGLYNDTNKQLIQVQADRNVKCGVQDHIKQRLTELEEFKDKLESEYQNELDKYAQIREQYQNWKLWTEKRQSKLRAIQSKEDEVKSAESKLTFDVEQGKKDKADLEEKLQQTNDSYKKTYQQSLNFETDLKQLVQVEKDGVALADKRSKLTTGKCPECGQPVTSDKHKELYNSYERQYSELSAKWDELDTKISTYPKGRDSKEYFVKLLTDVESAYKNLKDNIEILSNKINGYNESKARYDTLKSDLDKLKAELSDIDIEKPSTGEVKLPFELSNLEMTTNANLNKVKEYKRQKVDYDNVQLEIDDYDKQVSDLSIKLDRYNKYLELTANTGIIYEEILKKLAVRFSTPDVKYEVESGVYRGARFINFNAYYRVIGEVYRLYDDCSAGQKTVCDLDFLDKLFSTNIGILVLDEYLKHLDGDNFAKVCDLLQRINANVLILSTHEDNLTVYNRRIMLSLNEKGETQVVLA